MTRRNYFPLLRAFFVLFLCIVMVEKTHGQKFTKLLSTSSEFRSISYIDHAGNTMIVGENKTFIWIGDLQSNNFVAHAWEGYTTNGAVSFVYAHNSDTLFASIGHRKKRTFDRGRTWEEIGFELGRVSGLVSLND